MWIFNYALILTTASWRHNGRDGISNHQPHDCLLNRLFRRRSRKHQSSAPLAFGRWTHRWPVNSPHKWPVTRKIFPIYDVIMRGWSTHIAKTCWSTSIWYRSDAKVSDWCLIDIDPSVSAIWIRTWVRAPREDSSTECFSRYVNMFEINLKEIYKTHAIIQKTHQHVWCWYHIICGFLTRCILQCILHKHLFYVSEYHGWNNANTRCQQSCHMDIFYITYCGPVSPYGDINLGQLWLR